MDVAKKYFRVDLKVITTCFGELEGAISEDAIDIIVSEQDAEKLKNLVEEGLRQGVICIDGIKEI